MSNVLVCGATFGRFYLDALRQPDHAPFRLIGLLARGSDRARQCAEHFGIPMFTDITDLPSDIDIACVAVRSGLLGGNGSELARNLMNRGINVIQEHPVHQNELALSLRTAQRNSVAYHLNSFYVHTDPVRNFVAASRKLFLYREPLCIDAVCSTQSAYSLLDILGTALGRVRPWKFYTDNGQPCGPFRNISGILGGIPIALRLQHQLDPESPDDSEHVLHRITFFTEAGNLTLVDTSGPIIWQDRPYFKDIRRAIGPIEESPDYLARPHVSFFGTSSTPSYQKITRAIWPYGVLHALRTMQQSMENRENLLRNGQYHLALCQMWADAASTLGPPELIRGRTYDLLGDDEISAIAASAEAG